MRRESIRIEESLYPRYKADRTTSRSYAAAMEAGAVFPEIDVDQHGRVIDGLHRLNAYDINGVTNIPARLVRVRDDVDFFKRALAANAHHGHRYTQIDYAQMVLRGKDLGMTSNQIAEIVNVTPGFLDDVVRSWFGKNSDGELIPLKRSIAHMKGRTLTNDQVVANTKLCGWNASFLCTQVKLLLDNNLIDTENSAALLKVDELEESIRLYKIRRQRGRAA
jgi:ParB-like nuclease domain